MLFHLSIHTKNNMCIFKCLYIIFHTYFFYNIVNKVITTTPQGGKIMEDTACLYITVSNPAKKKNRWEKRATLREKPIGQRRSSTGHEASHGLDWAWSQPHAPPPRSDSRCGSARRRSPTTVGRSRVRAGAGEGTEGPADDREPEEDGELESMAGREEGDRRKGSVPAATAGSSRVVAGREEWRASFSRF